jgi:hypothetical protein
LQGPGFGRPGQKRAARDEEWGSGDSFGEPPERSDGRHVVVGDAKFFDAVLQDPGVLDWNGSRRVAQECGSLASRLEQSHRKIRPCDREGKARQASPRPDVDKSSAMRN